MEPVLATNLLPVEIWTYILAFLKPYQEFMPAMVCRDFYEILKARRNKRKETVWITDMVPFCKSIDWAKFIIRTRKNMFRSGFMQICVTITNIALKNNYYETYKHMAFLEFASTLCIKSLLKAKNYKLIVNVLNDGMPLDVMCTNNYNVFNNDYSLCIELIIHTNNRELIETMLKFERRLDTNIIVYAIKTHNIDTLNTVINVYNRAHLNHPHNCKNAVNYIMESSMIDVNDIKFMCKEYGYVYPSPDASTYAFCGHKFTYLEELIKYGCPVTHELEGVLYIVMPKLYAMLKPSQIVYPENHNEPVITLTSFISGMCHSINILDKCFHSYGTKLVIHFALIALNRKSLKLMTYLIQNKCQITKEIDDYLRIEIPDLYAIVDPSTINYNVEPLAPVFVKEQLLYEEIKRLERESALERSRLEMLNDSSFGLFD